MNWDQIEGKWMQLKGDVKQRWGKLTDSDLSMIAGSRDKLIGKIQERYGYQKEQAHREVQDWIDTFDRTSHKEHEPVSRR
jgi:uncharacterized protein YjbJ (UPF0337 family)